MRVLIFPTAGWNIRMEHEQTALDMAQKGQFGGFRFEYLNADQVKKHGKEA